MKPALVVLAAGRGTRFGGSKQTTPVGPAGEWLLDYALFDAHRAGFARAVLVVRQGSEADFDGLISRAPAELDVKAVPQWSGSTRAAIEDAPRTAPWGTGHALLAARVAVGERPFAVVNADDFYGAEAYRRAAEAAVRAGRDGVGTVVAMRLGDTLSPHGPVTRAVCTIADGHVVGLEEVGGVESREGRVGPAGGPDLDPDTLVSMNCWALPPAIFDLLTDEFRLFLERADASEFLLPAAISGLVRSGRLSLAAIAAPGPWFGLTHPADRPLVTEGLRRLTTAGVYPSPLAVRA